MYDLYDRFPLRIDDLYDRFPPRIDDLYNRFPLRIDDLYDRFPPRIDDLYNRFPLRTDDLYDRFPLHELDLSRQISSRSSPPGWDPKNSHGLAHVTWAVSVACRSCPTSHPLTTAGEDLKGSR